MANRFVHIELSTDDAEKAVAFYQQLFKWKTVTKARSLGATVHVEYQPIPGMGAMGIFLGPVRRFDRRVGGGAEDREEAGAEEEAREEKGKQ